MQALQSKSHHRSKRRVQAHPSSHILHGGPPRGAAVSLKGDIMIICDHENCPASATHLIFTPAGEIVLCSHHFNEVIADVLILGYEVHARVLEGV